MSRNVSSNTQLNDQRNLLVSVRPKKQHLLTGCSRRGVINLSIPPGFVAEGLQGGSVNSTPLLYLC